MLFRRFYDDALAQASYLIGCQATGQALVLDPNRDVEQYLAAAETERLAVTHVTETHIHADFVSGTRELARRSGAQLLLSGEGGPDWQYGFARSDGATLLEDGDTFRVGNVELRVLHTPGHTPEHLSFLVTDTAAASEPMGMLSGDFVFAGDVGRPDLLEKAAQMTGTMEAAAGDLYDSLQRLRDFPDHLQIWPGHGAGSACGKSLGAVPQTTLGYERIAGWAFGAKSRDAFVRAVLASQPPAPKYFGEMKRINRDGPGILGGFPSPPHLHLRDLERLQAAATLVVDTRSSSAFAGGHVPRTINIPATRSFTTWAGWLIPYDRDFALIVASDAEAEALVRQLVMIGLDRVAGYLTNDVIDAWRDGDRTLETVEQWRPGELWTAYAQGDVRVLDVRWDDEWESGHIPGAIHLPLGYLLDRLDEVPTDRPLAVHCQGGGRSAIAAGLLRAHGFERVRNVAGGFGEWARSGHPVERGDGTFATS